VSELVKVRADWHAEGLANGRTVAPGEPFPRADLSDDDQRLLDEGILIGASVTPAPLEGEELQSRAKTLGITGRAKMSADELREAVALAEAEQPAATTPASPAQTMGGER
jgi:hypothetical protein